MAIVITINVMLEVQPWNVSWKLVSIVSNHKQLLYKLLNTEPQGDIAY